MVKQRTDEAVTEVPFVAIEHRRRPILDVAGGERPHLARVQRASFGRFADVPTTHAGEGAVGRGR